MGIPPNQSTGKHRVIEGQDLWILTLSDTALGAHPTYETSVVWLNVQRPSAACPFEASG